MQKFKKRWEIKENWQLIFPALGVLILVYCCYKLAKLVVGDFSLIAVVLATILLYFILLKFILFLFKKLEHKWKVDYKWEMIRVFIVFTITGSSSVLIGKPIIHFIGITKENLNPFVYWILYSIIALVFYQILLVSFGWLFGQFQFFWNFEKKILYRLGFKSFKN
jgi:hypothetical protein